MRIDKYLSNLNYGSRSEIKKMIKQKRIKINRQIVKNGKEQLDLDNDILSINDNLISLEKSQYQYLMLNKPQGVITATSDNKQKTVLDLIDPKERVRGLFPVGRLDKDTTGFLLLTNDGQLAHELLAPKKHVAKTYYALIDGIVSENEVQEFKSGLHLKDGTVFKPALLTILKTDHNTNHTEIKITITEGKYHQIKRMFKACNSSVLKLHRMSMGPLNLDSQLEFGQYRKLTSEEIELLKINKD